jgi:hypothetical protein
MMTTMMTMRRRTIRRSFERWLAWEKFEIEGSAPTAAQSLVPFVPPVCVIREGNRLWQGYMILWLVRN